VAENIGLFHQPRAKDVVAERKFFLDYHSRQLPETSQGIQLDLPTQKEASAGNVRKINLTFQNVYKFVFYLGTRILLHFCEPR
jgi:hypothetical protein